MSIIGRLQNVGRNLIGALANIGTTNAEVLALDEGIGKAVAEHSAKRLTADALDAPYGENKPNRAQRRRRNRFRCSRNVEFHAKRGNKADGKGAQNQYAAWSHEEANNKGMNIMFNPLAQAIIKGTRTAQEAKGGAQV